MGVAPSATPSIARQHHGPAVAELGRSPGRGRPPRRSRACSDATPPTGLHRRDPHEQPTHASRADHFYRALSILARASREHGRERFHMRPSSRTGGEPCRRFARAMSCHGAAARGDDLRRRRAALTEAFVRMDVGGDYLGSGWFDLQAGYATLEGRKAKGGRLSHSCGPGRAAGLHRLRPDRLGRTAHGQLRPLQGAGAPAHQRSAARLPTPPGRQDGPDAVDA